MLKAISVMAFSLLLLVSSASGVTFQNDEKEAKLKEDIRLMWQTYKRPDGSGGGSTPEAVKAAQRVFDRVNLVGLTRSEVVKKLGDPMKADGIYFKHSAREVEEGALFYRFDTGIYGWQFNILFDEQGQVREVKRRIIE